MYWMALWGRGRVIIPDLHRSGCSPGPGPARALRVPALTGFGEFPNVVGLEFDAPTAEGRIHTPSFSQRPVEMS